MAVDNFLIQYDFGYKLGSYGVLRKAVVCAKGIDEGIDFIRSDFKVGTMHGMAEWPSVEARVIGVASHLVKEGVICSDYIEE